MTDDPTRIEHELLRDGVLFEDLDVVDTSVAPTVGNEEWHVRIKLRVDEDVAATTAFAIIFTLAAQSFEDARPRGASGMDFEERDEFSAADMLRHLRFEDGRLVLYVDYLLGRCLKTRVEITSDGRILLETVNRGKAATRWVDRMRGKKVLQAVPAADG